MSECEFELERARAEIADLSAEVSHLRSQRTQCKAEVDRLRAELATAKDVHLMLCWTTEPPTEPGWYWMLLDPEYAGRAFEPRVVQVQVDPRSGTLTEVNRSGRWHWAGPIPKPK